MVTLRPFPMGPGLSLVQQLERQPPTPVTMGIIRYNQLQWHVGLLEPGILYHWFAVRFLATPFLITFKGDTKCHGASVSIWLHTICRVYTLDWVYYIAGSVIQWHRILPVLQIKADPDIACMHGLWYHRLQHKVYSPSCKLQLKNCSKPEAPCRNLTIDWKKYTCLYDRYQEHMHEGMECLTTGIFYHLARYMYKSRHITAQCCWHYSCT